MLARFDTRGKGYDGRRVDRADSLVAASRRSKPAKPLSKARAPTLAAPTPAAPPPRTSAVDTKLLRSCPGDSVGSTRSMGWFSSRSDSVQTVEEAQHVVGALETSLTEKTDTVKSLRDEKKTARRDKRDRLVHDILELKTYRDSLKAMLTSLEASIAEKNTALSEHDAQDRRGSAAYKSLQTPTKSPARKK
mmetsp:Transcript_35864/g.107940  ORF Transcript_35864/g.107940 Transcript_35864/m.107940 type:complete len:191 (-) Transcript_35864:96-668(-)